MSAVAKRDVAIIGAGPAGAATAIKAAAGGAKVTVFEKAPPGRDKVCGDALTPRAVTALAELGIALDESHHIAGLRMIAGARRRELLWPDGNRFGSAGAVWPRRALDHHLIKAAENAGAEILWNTEVLPTISDDGSVVGVEQADGSSRWKAELVVLAAGAPGAAARMLGAERIGKEPYGIAIRTYAPSPRHAEHLLEACLTLRGADGSWVPGYGWLFPAGDGTVNIGAGVASTMKGFKSLNLNRLLNDYRDMFAQEWELGDYLERPRAWRLPMSTAKRYGAGWAAVGDAAGLINPMNGEGIDYGLESGMLLAEKFLTDPGSAASSYDQIIGERFDSFLTTGRRFCFLIGHPWVLRNGLRLTMASDSIANITLQVMGNLIDSETEGMSALVLRATDRTLKLADPLLRRTRSAA